MTVLLISDIHAKFDVINTQVRHAEDTTGQPIDQVMALGDFGFFSDELHDYFRRDGNSFLRPVACIDGNHEDHGNLHELAADYADHVTYKPRGSVHRLGSWRGLCLGGARYMDAWSTPRGCEITQDDVAACLSHAPEDIDLVLSHDCPEGIGMPNTAGLEHYGAPGVPQMARLAEHFRPRWWLFGHHHRWFDQQIDETRYIGLPQSWEGYVLLQADGQITMVQNKAPIGTRSRWRQWLGLR
jgi:Icc-related predicted phosphoesterase